MSFKPPTTDDLRVVAQTIWAEARGEPLKGRLGIAAVIGNRASIAAAYVAKHGGSHPIFGNGSLASACQAHFRDTYQFTCWSPDDPNHAGMLATTEEDPAYFGCVPMANALAAGTLADPTGGATNYLNVPLTLRLYGRLPSWVGGLTETVVIGAHTFYKG